jgi:hypothetical protein
MKHILNASQLMISTQQKKFIRTQELLREQIGNALNAIGTAVDVVAEEQETGRCEHGSESPQSLLEASQVVKVAVNIALIQSGIKKGYKKLCNRNINYLSEILS